LIFIQTPKRKAATADGAGNLLEHVERMLAAVGQTNHTDARAVGRMHKADGPGNHLFLVHIRSIAKTATSRGATIQRMGSTDPEKDSWARFSSYTIRAAATPRKWPRSSPTARPSFRLRKCVCARSPTPRP